MPGPLSMDLRERAMARLAAGETIRSVAAALSIAPSTVSKWSTHRRRTGSLRPARFGGSRPRRIVGAEAQWLRERVVSGPCTLCGLVAELGARGVRVHHSTVAEFLHRESLSYKKNPAAKRAG